MRHLALLSACVPIAAALMGCNTHEPPAFDPRAAARLERESATSVEARPMRALPTTLQSPYLDPSGTPRNTSNLPARPTTGQAAVVEPTMHLPLKEIIQRAVASNLDIRVAGYEPGIDATRTTEAEARFDPVFFVNLQLDDRNRSSAFATSTSVNGIEDSDTLLSSVGIRQELGTGGRAELRYEVRNVDYNDTAVGTAVDPNPYWENELILQFTQPLFRDFGFGVNQARIVVARNNQRITLLEFRRQIERTVSDIEQLYWQLVTAERDVQINESLLDNTISTADLLFKRLGQDVTRVQLSQANASVEQRRQTLIRARARVRDLSDQLKRQMNDPDFPVAGPTLILSGTPPVEQAITFNLPDQINAALDHRQEIGQQLLRIDNASEGVRVGRNGLLPQLNLVGQVGYQGLGSDFGSAVSNEADLDGVSYSVGLQYEIPIGNRAARALYKRGLLQKLQANESYRNIIDQVVLDVKQAAREVQTTWDEMSATRSARFASAETLRAIQQREEGGEPLSPTFVQLKLDTQERLAESARAENNAVSNYNIALARLELAKGTILRYNNIIMSEDGPTPDTTGVK